MPLRRDNHTSEQLSCGIDLLQLASSGESSYYSKNRITKKTSRYRKSIGEVTSAVRPGLLSHSSFRTIVSELTDVKVRYFW